MFFTDIWWYWSPCLKKSKAQKISQKGLGVQFVFLMGLWLRMTVFDGSLTGHVGLLLGMLVYNQYVGLQSVMSVSDGSPIRHVSLLWGMLVLMGLWGGMLVSDEACWYPMKHVCLRWVFRSVMSVSGGSPICLR